MIQAIVFDCDGTLVDSERLTNEVLVDYLAELGHAMSLEEAIASFTGMKMAACVSHLERRFQSSLPIDFVATFRARMEDAFAMKLKPMDGAVTLLRSLTRPFYLASSGPRTKIEHALAVTGLSRFFEPPHIFSAYEIDCWKPDPAFYSAVAASIGIAPANIAVVEDSLPGVTSALGAGMRTIVLGTHERLMPDFVAAQPAASLEEAGELLRRWCEAPGP